MLPLAVLLAACAAPATERPAPRPTGESTILFSGYEWKVRDGFGGPGPNQWNKGNVQLTRDGDLQLRITHTGRGWQNAEVETTQRLGFGRYQFEITGPIDRLDPNVVFGVFSYPTRDVGPDGTNEIDIEYAKWGRPENPKASWTAYPAQPGVAPAHKTFSVELEGTDTTNRFTWQSEQIAFQALAGHRDDDPNPLASWLYRPADPWRHISQHAMPVHMNLWLFAGRAPLDGREVEVVVHRFTFTPQ